MKNYIFQGSPDKFDIEGYLRESVDLHVPVTWLVSRYAEDMSVGDKVFFWRSAGKAKAISGVVGTGSIVSAPLLIEEDDLAEKYWIQGQPEGKAVRAQIEVSHLNIGNKEVVKRDWMKEDPILNDMLILRMASGTNFPLTGMQAERLVRLTQNTGVSWSKEESMAALWLYNETYNQPISKSHDSDVALIALIIGRAVTGVYNKLMNFRSIDPRDDRKGLSGINQVDQSVWNQYFDSGSNELDGTLLNEDFEFIWGSSRDLKAKVVPDAKSQHAPEARDDDISLKRLISVSYRKGQPAFRRRLLHLHNGTCVITGVNIPAVLDAAHIVDHARSGLNSSDNGLLLRSDIHDLFDAGLIRIDPEKYKVRIDESLKGSCYWQYHGQAVEKRADGSLPSSELIKLKNRTTG